MSDSDQRALATLADGCQSSFDVGLRLNTSTATAAAKMRSLRNRGLVDSFRPGPEQEDPDLYWELTFEGMAALCHGTGNKPQPPGEVVVRLSRELVERLLLDDTQARVRLRTELRAALQSHQDQED